MKILVTGANGFVGSWLVPRLQELQHDVVAAVYPDAKGDQSGFRERMQGAQIVDLDLTDSASVTAAVASKPDAVIHLAAVSSGTDARRDVGQAWEVNAAGTARLAEALARVDRQSRPRLLLASTGEVYGVPEGEAPFDERATPQPISPYAGSKLGAEIAAMEVSRRTGLRVIIARPFGHSGAGQDTRFVLPSFAKRIVDGKALNAVAVPVGNLECVRDFTSVHDVVEAYCLLLEQGTTGEVYNIASGTGVSLRDVFFMVADTVGTRVIPEVDAAFIRSADIPYLVGDASKLRKQTGWEPTVSIEAIVKEVVDACS